MSAELTFFFGLGSRYSYLASTQVPALERDTGKCVRWLPMVSGVLMQARGQNPFASRDAAGNWSGVSVSAQYDEHYRRGDLALWAAFYGVVYNEPVDPVLSAERRTLYCVASEMAGVAAPYCSAMFASMYADGAATTEDECLRLARNTGLDPEGLRDCVDSGRAAVRHKEIVALALDLKVFGVPTFLAGRELFWGNDRLLLLRHRLKSL